MLSSGLTVGKKDFQGMDSSSVFSSSFRVFIVVFISVSIPSSSSALLPTIQVTNPKTQAS